MELSDKIRENKIIAIVRGISSRYILDLADALYEGGIAMMEVTFDQTSKAGIQETLGSIALLKEKRQDKVKVGAGTVLTPDQVKAAREAGAEYIITPNVNRDVIDEAKKHQMVVMPGAYTPTEIELAYRAGADIVKVFPSSVAGPDYIRAVRGPLAHIPLAAVGGVDVQNIAEFFRAGVCCAGIGGCLVNKAQIEAGNFTWVCEKAREFTKALNG
ncbi:MAG: bifunctional 4-hydroxy-2-oxoglutarate aldolase/2-dehydro-3-deoxy-phosphogluconate aldolase [Lachnospiraceae bacterium]|nr:bifunctional 4-hydroxy-2-oxoglutarate aldolase/2-dehydro-3-deoxy-phosphogluconate aldolase [Lachnospiraceae bacterium]